ncbi:hypothetical protein M378DRAFT_171667 [Amanita muscaria Koide BX008]|uniref:Uncharacterized protein n=1 Tax=Amanita muscaria (strain Koide BX008) TaxID=946122 RepID=A0A0C2WLH6_AMAMK|nr:hypothetical protein M378DRAFT_171667 [Amanita muscaria Koide BX008]
MSAADPQVLPSSNLQSSLVSNGDNNSDNSGVIKMALETLLFLTTPTVRSTSKFPKTEGESELDRLLFPDISKDALHDSMHGPPLCHEGTRTTVCNAIVEWASASAGSPLLWLYGPAGVGRYSQDDIYELLRTKFGSSSCHFLPHEF